MIVSVRVERVTLDTASNRFVVILRDDAYKRWLPIVVGPAEAQAIALQMENVQPPRPMTHDLIKNILNNYILHFLHFQLFYKKIYTLIDQKWGY
ncbi:MAG: DUF151 domain-containing protein [bacterium]